MSEIHTMGRHVLKTIRDAEHAGALTTIRQSLVLGIALALLTAHAACFHIPEPSKEELKARDYWSRNLPPEIIMQVHEEAERHTNWGEKRKVQFEAEEYMHQDALQTARQRYAHPASNPARTKDSPTTAPVTAPASANGPAPAPGTH